MPTTDEEGNSRAILSDYLTDQVPTPTTRAWATEFTQGWTIEQYGSSNWRAFLNGLPEGRTPRMPLVYGVNGPVFDSLADTAFITGLGLGSYTEARFLDMVSRVQARSDLIGIDTSHAWQEVTPNKEWVTGGPTVSAHYLCTNAHDRTTTSNTMLALVRQAGTLGWSYDPVPGFEDAFTDYLETNIAANNWRFSVAHTSFPVVRPLANLTNTAGTLPEKPLAPGPTCLSVTDSHFYIPRTGDACAWVKELNPGPSAGEWLDHARIRSGEGATLAQLNRIYPLLPDDSGLNVKWHFATVDGTGAPGDAAEATNLIGVTDTGDWSLWGIDGLRNKPGSGYFTWTGRVAGGKALRLTLVSVPADYSPVGLTTLEDLLDTVDAIVRGQWELWPEDDVGPILPPKHPVERLIADSLPRVTSRIRLRTGIDGGSP